MKAATLLVLVLAVLVTSPAPAQDRSLAIVLNLEYGQVWQSEFEGLRYIAEFRNRLGEPLRWHPPNLAVFSSHLPDHALFSKSGRTAGILYQPTGYGPGGERTEVLAPGASDYIAWDLTQVVETDAKWIPLVEPQTQEYVYRGAPPVGAYTVWVRYYDGPAENAVSPERAPAPGIYTSNRVRLTVVRDGAPNTPQPQLLQELASPRGSRSRTLPNRGFALASARALAQNGVKGNAKP